MGIPAESFDTVLLSHHHFDHMSGLIYDQLIRAFARHEAPPLGVYLTEEPLELVNRMCSSNPTRIEIDQDGARNPGGRQVMRWNVIKPGQKISLGPTTTASCFPANHISGAVGWRVDSGGMAVIFSGDTMFNPELIKASQGARLLTHEAYRTDEEKEHAIHHGHPTAGGAGRSAAQAGIAELILTHLDSAFSADPQPLINDTQRYFSGPICAATGLYQITVSSP